MENKIPYDGFFWIDDKKIFYWISDDWSEKPRVVRGVEKIKRKILFYNDKFGLLGSYNAYDEYEKLQNISPFLAEEYYIKMINNEE